MVIKKHIIVSLLFLFPYFLISQNINIEIERLSEEVSFLKKKIDSLEVRIEKFKLDALKENLLLNGIPEIDEDDEMICHSAICLVYDEEHEIAKWVAHIISRDIVIGGVSRTNDFRIDTLIKTGSAEELDYFIKILNDDGTYTYDGFGYDRGHLAPSADFRWSATALSESYYYSNMSPQLPKFNREKWAEIENFLREYVYNNPERDLYVITAPVLRDDLPKQSRSKNNLSIPEYHYKIAVDLEYKIGIAFLVSQTQTDYPIESYVVSIDSIEKLTGINYFPNLSATDKDIIENQVNISDWRSGKKKNDVAPLSKQELPKNSYNTMEAKQFYEYPKEVNICGTVVSSHKSRNGHVFLNLDKSFPNQVFTATVWKSNLVNFSYEPDEFLINKKVCIKGKVKDYEGTPSSYPDSEKKILLLE